MSWALCECEKCGIASTCNVNLDILFSNWNMSDENIKTATEFFKTLNITRFVFE